MYYFTVEGLKSFKENFEEVKKEYYENVKQNNLDRETNINESGSFLHMRNELYTVFQYKKNDFYKKLENSIIIEETDEYINWDGKTVIRKCEVSLDFDGEVEVYKIVGYGENGNNTMYCDADFAKTLLGHKVDDTVDFRGNKIVIKEINPIKKFVNKKLELKK